MQDLKSNIATRQKSGCDALAGAQPDHRRAEVLPLLETLVNLPDLDLRYAATRAYCVWATRDNVPTLIKLLNNEKYLPRMQFVMEALARLKEERGLAPISQWLGKQGRARSDSIAALIAYGPAAEDHVISLLNTTDAEVRGGACEVLEQIGTRKCLPALEQAAMDSNLNVKSRAKRALDTVKKRL
jgi:HEAT repeat protein